MQCSSDLVSFLEITLNVAHRKRGWAHFVRRMGGEDVESGDDSDEDDDDDDTREESRQSLPSKSLQLSSQVELNSQ